MRTSFILATIISFSSLHAQPVLERSEMLPFGVTVPYRFYNDFAAVDTSIQGANVTWDFTGLSPQAGASTFSMTMVDPASTPHAALSAVDNYAYWEQPSGFYRFFQLTPTFMQRVGSYAGSNYVFSDPQVEYVFPLTYGTTNTDTWFGQADGGNYNLNCVGYGTLLLPGTTIEDVLMVRVGISGGFYDIDAYFWYSSTGGHILLQYINSLVATAGLYLDAEAVAVQEYQDLRATILANPVQDELNFVLSQQRNNMGYAVRSSSGALIATGMLAGNAGTLQSITTSGYTPGVYFLQITGSNAPVGTAVAFVKQ